MNEERERKLNELIDACWAHHAWVKGLRCNCNFKHPDPNDHKRTLPNAKFDRILPDNEIPILWFGDINAYEKSPRKIVTVGLNPSDGEFPKDKRRMFRFSDAVSLSYGTMDHLDEAQKLKYKSALNRYFLPKERNPRQGKAQYTYYHWFRGWDGVLDGMKASFMPKTQKFTVIHTDYCTPVATMPAWTKFGEQRPCVQIAIQQDARNRGLWKQLMGIFEPDLILSAVAGKMADKMAADLGTSNENQPGFADGDKKRKWTLAETNVFGKRSLFVNVPPQRRTPFSCWGKSAKFDFGETICSKLR